MKFCPKCGTQCADEDNFCIHCGNLLSNNQAVNGNQEEESRQTQNDDLQKTQASAFTGEESSPSVSEGENRNASTWGDDNLWNKTNDAAMNGVPLGGYEPNYEMRSVQNETSFRSKVRSVLCSKAMCVICVLLTVILGAEVVFSAVQGDFSLPILELLIVIFAWMAYNNAKQENPALVDGKSLGRVGGMLQVYFVMEIIVASCMAIAAAFVFSLGDGQIQQSITDAYNQGYLDYETYASVMALLENYIQIALTVIVGVAVAVVSCVGLRMLRLIVRDMSASVATNSNQLTPAVNRYKVAIGLLIGVVALNILSSIYSIYSLATVSSMNGSFVWDIIAQILDIVLNALYIVILVYSGKVIARFEEAATSEQELPV